MRPARLRGLRNAPPTKRPATTESTWPRSTIQAGLPRPSHLPRLAGVYLFRLTAPELRISEFPTAWVGRKRAFRSRLGPHPRSRRHAIHGWYMPDLSAITA